MEGEASGCPCSPPPKPLTAEDTDMLLGEDYQADLPQQRPRPSQPTPAEQQWLQHKALGFGELGSGTLVPEKTTTAPGYAQWCVTLHPLAQLRCDFCRAS